MSQIDRSLAEAARAWPFEEARKLVARDRRQNAGERLRAVRDRLRPVRPAAYRHLRRGRAHHHGAPGVPAAERRADAAVLLLRRHGRAAQGARQRAQQGDAGGPSRQAADRGAGSVQQRASVVRRGQQCAAAGVPRFVRLRVRVPVGDRMVQVGPLRQDAAADAAALRRGAGGDAADPRRRSGGRPIRSSCRSRPRPAACCRCR